MPSSPELQRNPKDDQVVRFMDAVRNHSNVSDVFRGESYLLYIERNHGEDITIWVTEIYTIGQSDVIDITRRCKGESIDAIVTLSVYNSYSSDAKDYAKQSEIGLFTWGEFFGALNYSGKRFVNYVKPDRDKDRRSRRF